MYLVGIDGGGTKTQFLLTDLQGRIHAQYRTTGSSYKEIGMEKVCELLVCGIEYLCADVRRCDIAGVCFGMPCYGESLENDKEMTLRIRQALSPLPVHIENDVTAAWAGALAFQPGIILLAGTGAMAVGRNEKGEFARSGGWTLLFSDEGSSYWLGKKTLELFSKQSDCRLPRGPLYDLVKSRLGLTRDFDLIDRTETEFALSRRKTAALQLILYDAAIAGDSSAVLAYEEAAAELSLLVNAIRIHLNMTDTTHVSYAGGLFKAGDLIMRPLRQHLIRSDIDFQKPLLQPVGGAILFAAEQFAPAHFESIRQGMLQPAGKPSVLY